MLRASHLSVAYGAHRALEDVGVAVERGEICVILGANGAGKTTLLKSLAGLVTPRPGARVTMDGEDITLAEPNRIVEKGLALVPEGRALFGDLSVRENLLLGAYGVQARAKRDERLARVNDLFPRLRERAGQIARTMSGGEQQMLAIGRGLMANPTIVMLDEPSLGLSPLLCTELFRTLRQIGDSGVGILLVEQNARLSLAIADRAYLLENGQLVAEGRAAMLANDPAVQSAYLGGAAAERSRRFGESEPAVPLAAAVATASPATLAERAARIQRAHVEKQRTGGPERVNGHASPLAPSLEQKETIVMSTGTDELSRSAPDLARRAAQILAAHVAAQRATATPALAPPPQAALRAQPFADAGEGRKQKKSGKKSGKKSKKARR
jgi:branched-chain amino acid transport system ATP-binding protein